MLRRLLWLLPTASVLALLVAALWIAADARAPKVGSVRPMAIV
jgi:hypothetical protein